MRRDEWIHMGSVQARAFSKVCSVGGSVESRVFASSRGRAEAGNLVAALKRCGGLKDLRMGRDLHQQAIETGLFSNIYVANTLIHMYSKCGSTADAQKVFNSMAHRDVVSWNCLIQGCVNNGENELAFGIFDQMTLSIVQGGGCAPDSRSYVAAMSACASLATGKDGGSRRRWLEKAEEVHSRAVKTRCCDRFLESRLVVLYAKSGLMPKARGVFDGMAARDVACWNALLQGYAENNESELALELFGKMEDCGYPPNSRTFIAALSACAALARKDGKMVEEIKALHARAVATHCCDIFVSCKLIDVYAISGCMSAAREVFDKMSDRNVVAWNSLIQGYVDNGESRTALELFDGMSGCNPNERTFVAALTACASLAERKDSSVVKWLRMGKDIHSRAMKSRCCNIFVENMLINVYSKCGSLDEARSVFDKMLKHDVVSWSSLLKGCVENGESELALKLFDGAAGKVNPEAFDPDDVFYITALTACVNLAENEDARAENSRRWLVAKGEKIYSQAVEQRCCNIFVENTLVDLYAKCGRMTSARDVFDRMLRRDVVTWTVLLQGYVDNGESRVAIELFDRMESSGECVPDSRTYIAALIACSTLAAQQQQMPDSRNEWLERGRAIHSRALNSDRCSVFVWNCWIRGCADNGLNELALELVADMHLSTGASPDSGTYIAALIACGNLMAIEAGQALHAQVLRRGLERDVLLATCLVEFYGKCGSMQVAEDLFESIHARDLAAWNAFLSGFSSRGDARNAFDVFQELREQGFSPNDRSFTHLLNACSHAGLTDKARACFGAMSSPEFGVRPTLVHYSCLVDLLARGNRLDEAVELIRGMPFEADSVLWTSVLGGCRTWKNVRVAQLAYEELLKLNSKNSAAYNLMANAFH